MQSLSCPKRYFEMSRKTSLVFLLILYTITFLSLKLLLPGLDCNTSDESLLQYFIILIIFTTFIFIFSLLVQNSSIQEPLWFTAPVVFITIINSQSQYAQTARNIFMIIPLIAHALKSLIYFLKFYPGLSYEDFRYRIFQAKINNKIFYWVFSYLVFHIFPTLLIFLRIAPFQYTLNENPVHQKSRQDHMAYYGSVVSLFGVLIEYIADNQLLPYRNSTNNQIANIGLWQNSRHPNYFGQIIQWWGLFLTIFSVQNPPYWIVLGPLSMTILINYYSIPLMENYLSLKRVGYKSYKERVSRLILWWRYPIEQIYY